MRFYCDDARHLICVPYSPKNLHLMAKQLNIKRGWYHRRARFSHYDIPKRRIDEIKAKCTVVATWELVELMKRTKMKQRMYIFKCEKCDKGERFVEHAFCLAKNEKEAWDKAQDAIKQHDLVYHPDDGEILKGKMVRLVPHGFEGLSKKEKKAVKEKLNADVSLLPIPGGL